MHKACRLLQERLRSFRRAVDKGMRQAVDAGLARELFVHEDNLQMSLAPFLHNKRRARAPFHAAFRCTPCLALACARASP